MIFDKDATVNVNELLNQFISHYRSVSFRDGSTVMNTYAITFIDVENVLKDIMTSCGLKQKVISGLEHCSRLGETRSCGDCPYIDDDYCTVNLKLDALKVLK